MNRQSHQPSQAPPSFLRRYGSFFVFLTAMAFIGFLMQFQWVGDVAIFLTALYVYIRRLPSYILFLLALLALGVVPVAIVLSNWLVAQNFAAYSFVFFIVGVVGLIMELQREPRRNVTSTASKGGALHRMHD